MKALIVIPARYASTRYPGKPLAQLQGASGASKSLIERTWDAAKSVYGGHRVVIATDDERISEAAQTFGAEVVMTSPDCANGTERCAEALENSGDTAEIVVNLQGDAPLTPPWFVEALLGAMQQGAAKVATPVLRCDAKAHAGFLEDRANGLVGGTTAVFDKNKRALYFSKEVIPYTGRTYTDQEVCPVFHHVGVYAYRADALISYIGWGAGPLEHLEGLEQLRFMENGVPVQCVEVDAKGCEFWELNNPVDVPRIEAIMKAQGID